MSYELTSLQLKIIGICWRKATCYYSFSFLISTFILHSELTEHNKCSCTYIAWSAPFVTSCEVVRKLGSFRLIAPRWPSTAAGAVSLKLPNFLTTSQDVRKGADQANCNKQLTAELFIYILRALKNNLRKRTRKMSIHYPNWVTWSMLCFPRIKRPFCLFSTK